jgi:hypothetical protein
LSSTATNETFLSHFEKKLQRIQVDEECVKIMVEAGHRTLPEVMKKILDGRVTPEELRCAVDKGKKNKAPGRDGINNAYLQSELGNNER